MSELSTEERKRLASADVSEGLGFAASPVPSGGRAPGALTVEEAEAVLDKFRIARGAHPGLEGEK